jgi:hypothetical protein
VAADDLTDYQTMRMYRIREWTMGILWSTHTNRTSPIGNHPTCPAVQEYESQHASVYYATAWLCYTRPSYATLPCYAMLCYSTLCCAMLCPMLPLVCYAGVGAGGYAMLLCYAMMLCYVMLCCRPCCHVMSCHVSHAVHYSVLCQPREPTNCYVAVPRFKSNSYFILLHFFSQ